MTDPADQPAAPRDDEERAALGALVGKYERMLQLRSELGRGRPEPAARERLRALAAEYPGALRELELLPTAEIERRLALAAGAEAPAWLLWLALYHSLMRGLLARRRAGAVEASPHGRLNVVVFAALAARFGLAAETIWDRLFPATGASRRGYRGL